MFKMQQGIYIQWSIARTNMIDCKSKPMDSPLHKWEDDELFTSGIVTMMTNDKHPFGEEMRQVCTGCGIVRFIEKNKSQPTGKKKAIIQINEQVGLKMLEEDLSSLISENSQSHDSYWNTKEHEEIVREMTIIKGQIYLLQHGKIEKSRY